MVEDKGKGRIRQDASAGEKGKNSGSLSNDDAAKRALAEAHKRQLTANLARKKPLQEIGGRGGLDPTRYGDWEVKGKASDF